MPTPNAESTSSMGTAGADDGFANAFNAAVEKVDLSGAEFAPDAMAVDETLKEPVETETPETATPDKPTGKTKLKAETAPAEKIPAAVVEGPQAPANWDAARREAFGSLPPEARQVVLDLAKGFQADATRVTTEAADDRRFSQSVKSLITNDHRTQMRRAGLSDEQGIAHLVGLNDLYTRDPVGYVKMVVERTGLDPRQIFPQFAGDGTPPAEGQQPQPGQSDPYSQLYGYLQSVQGKLDGYERERQQTVERTVNRSIDRFAQEKDADGTAPKHPHFDRVQGKMAQLLTTPDYLAIEDYGERLTAAYDAAVYLDPDIRTQLVDADVQKRMKDKLAADDLAKARRAKAPVKAAPTSTGKVKPDTLADSLRQSMSDVLG